MYSAGEMLKAPVPSEGRINFLPSNSLVGALIGLLSLRSVPWDPTRDHQDERKWSLRGTGLIGLTYPTVNAQDFRMVTRLICPQTAMRYLHGREH